MDHKMSVCTFVLVLIVMQVGLANCFSWDIILSEGNQLKFYNNGTLTYTEDFPSAEEIYSITYDPVHYRILFADRRYYRNHQISSFDLSTRNIQNLVTRKPDYYLRVTYDPVTQLLFWLEEWKSIYSFSLNPASSNKAVDGNLIFTLDHYTWDIAVESCGRYIYWMTDKEIERARFDGSEREVVLDSNVWLRRSLVTDQQTQKMYWTEKVDNSDKVYIESADFNGKNRRTFYTVKNEEQASSLTVSNDFIYWHGKNQNAILQLPKNLSQQLEKKLFSTSETVFWAWHVLAVNYTIKEQLKGNQNCETLKSLIPKESKPDCMDVMLCIHGTKVRGESRCECTQGYTGEKCDVYVCQNYCVQGNCSVSAEGQPICSCKTGYSGQRCEVNTCHGYCLNSGICSLNKEHHPVCQCTADYDGERCAVPTVVTKCIQAVSTLRDMLNAGIPPVTLSKGVQPKCASTVF